jgi:hypothetical protein
MHAAVCLCQRFGLKLDDFRNDINGTSHAITLKICYIFKCRFGDIRKEICNINIFKLQPNHAKYNLDMIF